MKRGVARRGVAHGVARSLARSLSTGLFHEFVHPSRSWRCSHRARFTLDTPLATTRGTHTNHEKNTRQDGPPYESGHRECSSLFSASACSATFKTWCPCSTGGMEFTSVCVVSWHEIVPTTKRKFASRKVPISFGNVRPEWGWLLAHYDHFPNVFLNPLVEGGTGLEEKRSIGRPVPRSPGGNIGNCRGVSDGKDRS